MRGPSSPLHPLTARSCRGNSVPGRRGSGASAGAKAPTGGLGATQKQRGDRRSGQSVSFCFGDGAGTFEGLSGSSCTNVLGSPDACRLKFLRALSSSPGCGGANRASALCCDGVLGCLGCSFSSVKGHHLSYFANDIGEVMRGLPDGLSHKEAVALLLKGTVQPGRVKAEPQARAKRCLDVPRQHLHRRRATRYALDGGLSRAYGPRN